jgi:amidase
VAELLYRPATELAAMVRRGEVSGRELVEAALQGIEALEPELNAFVLVDAERALEAADRVEPGDERPFAGVPIAIKDEVPVAGQRLTAGSQLFGDFVPEFDAFVVRRLREAGFVIVGRTNMPEFGLLPVTEPRRYGPTRNPWDVGRTPGGSSGGSAAAVAAGMVPVAHGADGGGSIRIPAACCGLVGLKPARGRISRGPTQGDHPLVTDGVLTRTVEDTARLLDVMAGYELGDASWAPPPSAPFAEAAGRDPGRLRIGVSTVPPIDVEVDAASRRAVAEAAELLASLGHDVSEVDAPWRSLDVLPVFTRVFGTHVVVGAVFAGLVTGRQPSPELVEPLTWSIYEHIREMAGYDYVLALTQLQTLSRGMLSLWTSHDVVVTPALGLRPVAIGEIDACSDDPWEDFRRSGHFVPFTAMFNVSGQPAVSVPLFEGEDGLPLAVQLAGPPAGEEVLISLAAQLEAARPWAERRPAVAA